MPKFGDRKAGRAASEREPSEQLMVASTHDETSEPVRDGAGPDFARLGEHVGTVLEAAKDAAEKMRLQAAEDARKMRAEAEHQASTTLEEARRQKRGIEAHAAQLETAAREESAKIRDEASAHAETVREAADGKAAKILGHAERHAAEQVHLTQDRLETLEAQVADTEKRLRQLVGRLRELALSLDDLVSGPRSAEKDVPAAGRKERESLTDTLSQSVSERRQPAPSTKPL